MKKILAFAGMTIRFCLYGAKVFKLSRNYRVTPPICGFRKNHIVMKFINELDSCYFRNDLVGSVRC